MNDDQLDDLKQFIDSRMSQTEARIEENIDSKLNVVREEINDKVGGIADAIEQIHELIDSEHTTTNRRLTKLEQQSIS